MRWKDRWALNMPAAVQRGTICPLRQRVTLQLGGARWRSSTRSGRRCSAFSRADVEFHRCLLLVNDSLGVNSAVEGGFDSRPIVSQAASDNRPARPILRSLCFNPVHVEAARSRSTASAGSKPR